MELNNYDKVMDLAKQVIPYFEKTFFTRYIQDYKDYLWYTWDRKRELEEWQTNVVFPLVSWLVDTMYASIYDSKFKFNVSTDWIEGTDKLLNHSFDYEWRGRNAVMSASKEAIITWKGYIEPYLINMQEKKKVKWKNYGKKIKVPVIDYLSIFDVFYDYSKRLEDSPFTMKRSILSRKAILKKYNNLVDASKIDSVLSNEEWIYRYSNCDYNRVKHIIAYEELVWSNKKLLTNVANIPRQEAPYNTWESIDSMNNIFAVDFTKNKVYEVIEYSDDDGITVLVDWKGLLTQPRKLWMDWVLIQSISFNEIPWINDSLWIASKNRHAQMMSNTLFNIYLDNLKMWIAPMFESVGWMNQFLGTSNKFKYEPYKVYSTNTPNSLRKIDLTINWFEPVNAIQFISTYSKENSWISEYVMWVQGKVERVSSGTDMLLNAFKSRLMPLVNSINTAMWNIGKILLLIYATYFKVDELRKLWLEWELDYERFLDESNVNFRMTSLALLEEEEQLEYLMNNLPVISWLSQWEDGKPTVNIKELLTAILTKKVDINKILTPSEPPQQEEVPWMDIWTTSQEHTPEELINMLW